MVWMLCAGYARAQRSDASRVNELQGSSGLGCPETLARYPSREIGNAEESRSIWAEIVQKKRDLCCFSLLFNILVHCVVNKHNCNMPVHPVRHHNARGPMPRVSAATLERYDQVGRQLGRVANGYACADLAEFLQYLKIRRHPLWILMEVVNGTALDSRRRFDRSSLRMAIIQGRMARGQRWFLEECFALYCSERYRAAPRSVQPQVELRQGGRMPRRMRRTLRTQGVRSLPRRERRSFHVRAVEAFKELWDGMQGRSVVMWMDNFYLRRWGTDPLRENLSVNTSVSAVLHVPTLLPFGGQPPIGRLEEGCRVACRVIMEAHAGLMRELSVLCQSVTRLTMRVPLDVVRLDVHTLQWKPFALVNAVIGTNKGLLQMVQMALSCLDRHARSPMPLLVDVDVYQRLMRMIYHPNLLLWDTSALSRRLPPLFGVWHAYKHCCLMLHRRFLPWFHYLKTGSIAIRESVNGGPKLRSVEMMVGCLMLLGADTRSGLEGSSGVAMLCGLSGLSVIRRWPVLFSLQTEILIKTDSNRRNMNAQLRNYLVRRPC